MLRTKLTLWNCTILALALGAIGASIYLTSRAPLFHSVNSTLLHRAALFNAQWRGLADAERTATANSLYDGPDVMAPVAPETALREGIDPLQLQRFQATGEALRPMVLTPDGEDVLTSRRAWDWIGFRKAELGNTIFSDITYHGVSLRVLSLPLFERGKITAVMQLAVPLQWEQEQLSQLSRTLLIVLPAAVGLMLLIGVILTRRALRPFSQIVLAAEAIEAANLSGRLPVVGRDEFAELSNTFNRMLSRLHDAFDEKERALLRQKRFTSDASHELKTPLTAIRARAGIALLNPPEPDELVDHIAAMNRSAELMSCVVQDLLLLAASDEGQLQLRKEPSSVRVLVEDALASVDASNHCVDVRLNEEATIVCDPSALTRVLVNLLQNAITNTPAGREIRVSSTASSDAVTFVVADRGVGIPPEHLDRIFDRFHRVDSSRDRGSGGSGLGLAIAKAIIEAHGGTISMASELGKGAAVTLSLPR